MTTIDILTPKASLPRSATFGRWRDWCRLAFGGLRQGWRAHRRYRRLAALSDDALAARGLKRDQIGRHAFFGADRADR